MLAGPVWKTTWSVAVDGSSATDETVGPCVAMTRTPDRRAGRERRRSGRRGPVAVSNCEAVIDVDAGGERR